MGAGRGYASAFRMAAPSERRNEQGEGAPCAAMAACAAGVPECPGTLCPVGGTFMQDLQKIKMDLFSRQGFAPQAEK